MLASIDVSANATRTRCRLNTQVGVCLAEVLIAMAAGLVVLSAAFQILTALHGKLSNQQQRVNLHQDHRLGLGVLEDELRMAGSGARPPMPAFIKTEEREVEFYANLDGLTTVLTAPASSVDRELTVASGLDWRKGKRILICESERCAEAELARDGRSNALSITAPLGEAFAAGSEVVMSNQVAYYLKTGRDGKQTLMRRVDGGTNSLIGEVTYFKLVYLDRDGATVVLPGDVRRIGLELNVGEDRIALKTEVGIRG